MNNKQIKYWYEDGILHADYSFKDRDDPEDDGNPVLYTCLKGEDDEITRKRIKCRLIRQYDLWMDFRDNGHSREEWDRLDVREIEIMSGRREP